MKLFSKIVKYISTFLKQAEYEVVNVNDNLESFVLLKKRFKFSLIENNVPVDRIKFISKKYFFYDVMTKEINPKQTILVQSQSTKKNNTLITLNNNVVKINLNHYYSLLNIYEFIKNMIKISKHGIIIMVNNELLNDSNDIYLFNLDELYYNLN